MRIRRPGLQKYEWLQKPPPGSRIDWTHPLARGLIGCWLFNEEGGALALDLSPTQAHGTITGPTWNNGESGLRRPALKFDGIDDIVNCGSNPVFDNLAPFSIVTRFFTSTLGENNRGRIVDKANLTTPTNGWIFHLSNAEASAQLGFQADYSGGQLLVRRSNASGISGISPTNSGMSWDGSASASNVHLYKDGIELSYAVTQDGTGSRVDDSAEDFKIGNDKSLARTFDGPIEYLFLYKRVLLPVEFQWSYSKPFCFILPPTPRVRYFFLTELVVSPDRYAQPLEIVVPQTTGIVGY